MSLSYRYGDDPYYASRDYERGYEDATGQLSGTHTDLIEHLGQVVDELYAYIFRLDETFNRPLTDEENKLVEMGRAVLQRIKDEL